ncbi:Pantoate--beta-alanine ligase (AMP-forming) [Flagellimonas maritima]|uniref:Pantothenate synthetase n=1 Tax=Flagellimonas maritima TaxID=1383885 RepID=A0A2Z4LQS8_9FLAO|nr:pantoate--beta-alanine ligase [Allomuricauda aurantiaca]AWX44205.1 Pantoate--beta-alanine ligase (AMP-forming) [Allomuricauda aurantiaca]
MHVFDHKGELRSYIKEKKDGKNIIGLVPTMGALHQGHVSLIKQALFQNDLVVVSIFVNPTQFNKKADLEKYPRNLQGDLIILEHQSDNIIVFTPTVDEIYGESIVSNTYQFDGLDKVMEGEFREGHFEGVATIVELLLLTISPDRAYFGEKDFQQLQIIKKIVESKNMPIEIVGCPIEREPHGLAMSSRNERLSKEVRIEAGLLYKVLLSAKRKFGTESADEITDWVKSQFKKNTLLDLEYFQIADEATLTPILKVQPKKKYRAFIAVYADDVRLIDNLRLN